MSEDFRDFWRDDFTCLKHAGRLLTEAMRRDEQTLEDRINTGHNPSSHLYYLAGSGATTTDPTNDDNADGSGSDNANHAVLQFQRRIPMPQFLSNLATTRNFKMGLWTHDGAQLAWAICADTVYLWNFLDTAGNSRPYFFATTNQQHVIAVGLVKPKPNVFVEGVTWCLVVTTIECVYISALFRGQFNDGGGGSSNGGKINAASTSLPERKLLVANVFKAPSDGVRFTVVTGSKDGRIFLGGANGDLCVIDYWDGPQHPEMNWYEKLDQFYDGSLELRSELSIDTSIVSKIGKRMRDSLFHDTTPGRKCRKSNIGTVTEGYSYITLFPATEGDGVDQILVDDDRGNLFALTKSGYLSCRHLTEPTKVVSKMNVMDEASEFLRRIGRRDAMFGAFLTNAAAVGGQDQARTMAQKDRPLLKPVTMHLITRTESIKYGLAIVTRGGLRLFIAVGARSLTLGHIRGAPPLLTNNNSNQNQRYNNGAVDFEVDASGGYRPSLPSEAAVNAATYHKGMLVAAFVHPGDTSSTIVAAGPDSQLRTMKQNGKDVRQVPGGITESLSFPLGEAKLGGGMIFDIGVIEEPIKPTQTLLEYSASPSDQDLRRPLLPLPYSPPSTEKKTSEVSTIIPYKRQTGFEFLQQVAAAAILQSLRVRPTKRTEEQDYRISKRSALMGFSSTAAEKVNVKLTKDSQSFRIKQWLIQPRPVSLQYMAAQYPPDKCQVVLMNADGFYLFARTSPLGRLALAISGTGRGVSFFERFRRRECCAMGLALAMGLYQPSAHLQRQAEQLVMDQGKTPILRLRSSQAGSTPAVAATTNADDSLVPLRYEFIPSPLCDGLIFLVSRLLRPIWHKPLVVVTEGPTLKRTGSASFSSPAKVELLLDEATAKEIILPLYQLVQLLSRMFHRAIVTIPGVTNPNVDRMEVDENDSILHPLQARNALFTNPMQTEVIDPARLSRKLEDRNIHSLYRTLARSCQLLDLFSLLQSQAKPRHLNVSIQWGLLHGISFSEFVESSEGQDRLETLLNKLLASMRGLNNKLSAQQLDNLTSRLSSQCYYFFSPGSQSECIGHQFAARALSGPTETKQFFDLRDKAAYYFVEAAHHWHSPALITGRTMHTGRPASHIELVQTAERHGSPLAMAANVLAELGDVVNAAKVCLETAANFQPQDSRDSFKLTYRSGPESGFAWEKPLYHRRQATSEGGSISVNGIRSSMQSPGRCEVTYEDATDTCFAFIFSFIERLMGSQVDLAERLLSFCSSSKDTVFLERLFGFLLDGYQDALLRICSPDLENWLKKGQHSVLLWRYFSLHKRYDEACQLALGIASDSSSRLELSRRIEWLDRAAVFYDEMNQANDAVVTLQRNEAIEKCNLARLQERILRALQTLNVSEDVTDALRTALLPVTDLYNQYAAKHGLAEECLRIFDVCKRDDPINIQRLWRLVVCGELLPSTTRERAKYDYLTAQAREFKLEQQITLLRDSEHSSQAMFEDLLWVDNLLKRIASIRKDLYESSASFVFPVPYLIERLEELRRLVGHFSPGWSLTFLVEAGVPMMDVLEAFESVTRESNNGLTLRTVSAAEQMEEVAAILELIEYALSRREPMERDRLLLKMDSMRRRIDNMAGSRDLQGRFEHVYREIQLPPGAVM